MKSIIFLSLLLIFIQVEAKYSTKCGTDKLKIRPKPINLSKSSKMGSISKATSYTPISIGYDFTTLEKPSSMSSSTFSNVKSLLQETRVEFSKILQIQHQKIDLSKYVADLIEVCGIDTIGEDYPNFLIENDLIIFPMFDDLGAETLAAAAPCITDDNLRPIAGILYLNYDLNFNIKNTNLYMKNLLLHEITHILAFHPFYFQYLGMSRTIGSDSYIISKKVIEKAREHFNCNSLTEIQLENQGGTGSVGSHWESRYMLGDYMISTDYPDVTISDLTLALFEDTGFYKVNYYSGGLFKFGKNKGCSFFNTKCIINEKAAFDDFCDVEDKPICSSSRALKSVCYLGEGTEIIPTQYQYFNNPYKGGFSFADYCPVPLYYDYDFLDYFPNHCLVGTLNSSYAYEETIGTDSLCFMSSLIPNSFENELSSQIPVCYKVECDTSNNNIIVIVGTQRITCPNEGGLVSNIDGLKGSIECPKYSDICSSNDNLICNGMFDCFTKLANKNNYNYQTSYYDYSGRTYDLYDDYYYDYFDEYDLFGSNNFEINLYVLLICLILYIN